MSLVSHCVNRPKLSLKVSHRAQDLRDAGVSEHMVQNIIALEHPRDGHKSQQDSKRRRIAVEPEVMFLDSDYVVLFRHED